MCLCTFFLAASHKLFKGTHKIGEARVKVEAASSPPSPKQLQNAVYKPGTTPTFVTEQQTPSSFTKDQLKTTPPFSTNQPTPPPATTSQKVQPPARTDQQQPVKDRNPSYIMVSGLTNSISTEDIVAHFQTARCGGGTVTEVIHLEQSKDRALVGISGIELNRKFVIDKKTY